MSTEHISLFQILHNIKVDSVTYSAEETSDDRKRQFKTELDTFFSIPLARQRAEKNGKKQNYTILAGDLVLLKDVIR